MEQPSEVLDKGATAFRVLAYQSQGRLSRREMSLDEIAS